MDYTIEVCAATITSAIAAQRSGAQRIELCSELGVGGVTPSAGVIAQVRKSIGIAINILIRPRSGEFIYTSDEAESVLRDIAAAASMGVQGVVVGALTEDSAIDREMCAEWLREAHRHGLSATFHRAIDSSADIMSALDTIASMGYDRILSSGGMPTAYEGMETLAAMHRATRKSGPVIMPGSGINADNIREIATVTGVSELHMSGSRKYPPAMRVLGGIAHPEEQTHSSTEAIMSAIAALS